MSVWMGPVSDHISGSREYVLRTRILTNNAVTSTMALFGDPLARLLRAPWRDDPYPIYESLRAKGSLVRSRLGPRIAMDHQTCDAILRDSRFGVRTSDGGPGDPLASELGVRLSLLETDPPDHTRLRRLAAPAFRARVLEAYRTRIEEVAEALLDRAEQRGSFDLIRDFATPLPIRVIGDLLGLPAIGTDRLAHHGAVLGGTLDGIRSTRHLRRMRDSYAELESLFTELIDQRKLDPGSDALSELVHGFESERLTAEELVSLCDLLLVAGFETTVNLIGNATRALLRDRVQWELLRERPELAKDAVEETLRWDPPVQATVRMPHEQVEVAGNTIRRDTSVLLMLAAAGRDPDRYDNPASFDITRGRADHLAFSSGIHYCLGAPLARMEASCALGALAARMPKLRQAGPEKRRPTTIIRGLSHLPVESRGSPER